MSDEQPDPNDIRYKPQLLGCIFGFVWLTLIPITLLFFIAGYGAIHSGQANGEAPLAEFGWWLVGAGIACAVILCCTLILNMRIRKLMREHAIEAMSNDAAEEESVEAR